MTAHMFITAFAGFRNAEYRTRRETLPADDVTVSLLEIQIRVQHARAHFCWLAETSASLLSIVTSAKSAT